MKFTPEQLKAVMDSVRLDAALSPVREQSGHLITYCNLNAYRVAQALGLAIFHNYDADRPMLASEMVYYMGQSPEKFSKFTNHTIAHDLANRGYLVLAAVAGDPHGHIAPVYPTAGMETSGKWKTQVPFLSNVGVRNDIIGANYAFADEPFYYVVV
jgi:hypothetical protein